MSQIAPIALTALTFSPVAHVGNLVTYKDLAEPIPALRKTLTVSLTEPSKTQKLYKARFRLISPVEKMSTDATPVGLGIVDHLNSFDMVLTHDERSTDVERGELFDILTEFLAKPVVSEIAVDLVPLY